MSASAASASLTVFLRAGWCMLRAAGWPRCLLAALLAIAACTAAEPSPASESIPAPLNELLLRAGVPPSVIDQLLFAAFESFYLRQEAVTLKDYAIVRHCPGRLV